MWGNIRDKQLHGKELLRNKIVLAKLGIHFIIAEEPDEQLDKNFVESGEAKSFVATSMEKCPGEALQRLIKLKQHLEMCNTIHVGSSLNINKRMNVLKPKQEILAKSTELLRITREYIAFIENVLTRKTFMR